MCRPSEVLQLMVTRRVNTTVTTGTPENTSQILSFLPGKCASKWLPSPISFGLSVASSWLAKFDIMLSTKSSLDIGESVFLWYNIYESNTEMPNNAPRPR
ncbi:hypothetical protein J6590_034563 [Homalodisca vitripennis]|nr:hypothetical protein J6590_034563 [Homalodisca vitripennis]